MRMPLIAGVLFMVFLSACKPVSGPSKIFITPSLSPQASPTVEPKSTISPTDTPFKVCNPEISYCIVDGHFIFQRPVQSSGNSLIDPTYRFGSTQDGLRQPHNGVEFPSPSGTPVYSAFGGRVIFAGNDSITIHSPWPDFYGNLVVIEHKIESFESPVFTLYAHLSKLSVKAGTVVAAGEKVGEVGLTGVAVGSHLHFEVRVGSNTYEAAQNPELWLIPDRSSDGQLKSALAVRIIDGSLQLFEIPVNVQLFEDPDSSPEFTFYETTYAETVRSDVEWKEMLALSNLQPGLYRISFIYDGVLIERWVELFPGKLTLVKFRIK